MAGSSERSVAKRAVGPYVRVTTHVRLAVDYCPILSTRVKPYVCTM